MTALSPVHTELLIREEGASWEPLPAWVRFFIDFGFAWPVDGIRRLAFVSTPCDSAGAALIALGALLKRLTIAEANDLKSHFDRLNGLVPSGDTHVRLRSRPKSRYAVSGRNEGGHLRFCEQKEDGETRVLLEANAHEWYLVGEPPIELRGGEALPHGDFYRILIGVTRSIHERNLKTTDSSVVLAGRVRGKAATEAIVAAVQLKHADREVSLKELLAVHGWQPNTVSRIRYFNPRQLTGSPFDRGGQQPSLIIADGLPVYDRVRRDKFCHAASVITVTSRCGDPKDLEDAGDAIAGLAQWFETDPTIPNIGLPVPPPGIVAGVLRARG